MHTLLVLAALALSVFVTGCQRAPATGPAPASVPAGPLTGRLKAEGDALMAQQNYEQAAVKYQTALNEAPNDIPIRYALAIALSYLPRRQETIEQFRIILDRGEPNSFEVKAARDWLANAKALDGMETAGTGASSTWPRIQSAKTTRPAATAHTPPPSGARKNTPFGDRPAACCWARLASVTVLRFASG